jgi:hypothetical protein
LSVALRQCDKTTLINQVGDRLASHTIPILQNVHVATQDDATFAIKELGLGGGCLNLSGWVVDLDVTPCRNHFGGSVSFLDIGTDGDGTTIPSLSLGVL